MGSAMWKRVFEHMWTAKAQISLRIRAVWSGPLLSAKKKKKKKKKKIIGYQRMLQWRENARMRLRIVSDDENSHILRMF